MARVTVTIAQESGGNLQLVKGATVKAYIYDTGQPNNRGTLLATLTETPSNSGQYVFDLSGTERIVVTANTGSGEENLPAWEGKKVWGTQATTDDYQDNSVTTIKLPDESITGAKCAVGFLEQWHFTTDIVPAGAIEDAAFNTTEFEKIAGVFRHKANGTSGANITDNTIPDAKIIALDGAKITDATIPAAKIIPESLTDNEMSDEILIARMFAADQVEAAHVNPTLMFNTTQFERSGSPAKWQLKADFLSTIDAGSVPYIVNVLDYGADTSGAGSSSQAFQDAFDAIGEEKGIVVIPPGTYLVKDVTISENVWIIAHGALIVLGGSNPTGETSTDKWIFKLAGSSGNLKTNIRIDGGTWRGELVSDYTLQTTGELFDFTYCQNLQIANATLEKSRRHAIDLTGCDNVSVQNCLIQNHGGYAVNCEGSTNVFVEKNRFLEVRKALFSYTFATVADSENVWFVNNSVNSYGNAVELEVVRNHYILNNVIEYGSAAVTPALAFYITVVSVSAITNTLENVYFCNNTVNNWGYGGFAFIISSDASTYRNIHFSNNKAYHCGISILQSPWMSIENNVFVDIKGSGTQKTFQFYAASPFSFLNIKNNHIEIEATAGGFYLSQAGTCTTINIENNVIKYGTDYVFSFTASEKAQFRNNVIMASFAISVANAILVNNQIEGAVTINNPVEFLNNYVDATGETEGVVVQSSAAGCLLDDNTVIAGGTGIKVATSDNILYNNKCFDQTAYGIQLTAAADDNLVKGSIIRNPGTAATDDNGTGNTLTDNTTI